MNNVLLIDEDGNKVGVIPKKDAYNRAKDVGLDLIEVSPNSNPPVCKIMDHGKVIYEQKKKQKNNEHKKNIIKEIQLGLNIDIHDLNIKAKQIQKFIQKQYKVKIKVKFKGRETKHYNIGFDLINKLYDIIGRDICKFENEPKIEGKNISALLSKI